MKKVLSTIAITSIVLVGCNNANVETFNHYVDYFNIESIIPNANGIGEPIEDIGSSKKQLHYQKTIKENIGVNSLETTTYEVYLQIKCDSEACISITEQYRIQNWDTKESVTIDNIENLSKYFIGLTEMIRSRSALYKDSGEGTIQYRFTRYNDAII